VAAVKATHTPPFIDPDTGMTPGELLRGAALYLQRHGWLQGDFFDLLAEAAFPPACAIGAINICAHGRPILGSDDTADDAHTDAAIRAMRVLAAYLDPYYADTTGIPYGPSAIDVVSDWNDHDGRTLHDVVTALTDAADDWDSTHQTRGAR
jgi:hypothetical protein